jgi:hypothetical protein
MKLAPGCPLKELGPSRFIPMSTLDWEDGGGACWEELNCPTDIIGVMEGEEVTVVYVRAYPELLPPE